MQSHGRISILIIVISTLVSCKKATNETINNYTVYGKVINQSGLGIAAAKIYYNDTGFTTSNIDGNWSISNLSSSHTLKAQRDNFLFTPAQIIVSNTTTDIVFIGNDTSHNQLSSNEIKLLNWLTDLQFPNGILESSKNSNFVSLYDNALSALVLMSYGDYARTEKIFDFFNARINSELLNGNGGFSQTRNSTGTPDNNKWMGDNAWLLLALKNYNIITSSNKYNSLINALENWLKALQDTDGGLWAGYDANGLMSSKVTEGNIDAFVAITGYDNFHKKLLSFLKNQRWDATQKILLSWPSNPAYVYALDMHSWGYCSIEDFPVTVLSKANMFLNTQTCTATTSTITGYCFDVDKDDVWLEGTGEMVVAFQSAGLTTEANYYLAQIEKAIVTPSYLPNAIGIPYASNRATGYGNTTLWVGSDINPAISSAAWYLFAKHKFNPFKLLRSKNIPSIDKFWN